MHDHTKRLNNNDNNNVRVLWNNEIRTDREVMSNRPDIITNNNKDKTCILKDVAILAARMSRKR